MAINVICPGCMTRFQVDDRFAGKKGPCPKCGHIIEIPKENLVIHAPDDITTAAAPGKKGYRGDNVRPILQTRFVFTKTRVFLGLVGVAALIVLASFLASWEPSHTKNIIGGIGLWLLGMPLAAFGYMMVREDDDLEIFLGNELYWRSFLTALTFAASWLILEWLVSYLDPGPLVVIYLVPVAVLASFAAMIIFDTEFGKAVLLYSVFAISIIGLRGLMYAPDGWIWEPAPIQIRAVQTPTTGVSSEPVSGETSESKQEAVKVEPREKAAPSAAKPGPVLPQKKTLDREAPDPRKGFRR